MRYFLIAGEASGDLHGSYLIRALQDRDQEADILCWGGEKMEQAGGKLLKHYRELAYMGFVEVVRHLKTIIKNLRECKRTIESFRPDVLVLIDYPGFNMRIAAWAKKKGFRIAYYISPQLWAWKEGRVKSIKRDVDKMLVILPFEKSFYKQHRLEVTYVGHPLIEVVLAHRKKLPEPLSKKPIIAILPGSRRQEIQKKLPIMLSVLQAFPEYQFVVAQAPSLPSTFYEPFLVNSTTLLVANNTYSLLQQARAALVTSGTATLETALFDVPQVVCYKGNPASYWLAKRLVTIKYISLVNLILDRAAVVELIQENLTKKTVSEELDRLLHDAEYRARIKSDYQELWQKLGSHKASESAAEEIVALAKQPH